MRDNRRNETYFAKGRLVAEQGKPEAGAFIDQVIAEVSEPLGAPELLTTLIANNLVLTHQLVDKRMLHQLAGFVGDHGPRPDLAQILAATLSCHGKAIPGVQEMVVSTLFTKDVSELFRRTFLETAVVKGDTAFRAREWPCAKVDDPPDGFLGYEELERAARPCVCGGWVLKLPGWRIVLRRPDAWIEDGCERLGRAARANAGARRQDLPARAAGCEERAGRDRSH